MASHHHCGCCEEEGCCPDGRPCDWEGARFRVWFDYDATFRRCCIYEINPIQWIDETLSYSKTSDKSPWVNMNCPESGNTPFACANTGFNDFVEADRECFSGHSFGATIGVELENRIGEPSPRFRISVGFCTGSPIPDPACAYVFKTLPACTGTFQLIVCDYVLGDPYELCDAGPLTQEQSQLESITVYIEIEGGTACAGSRAVSELTERAVVAEAERTLEDAERDAEPSERDPEALAAERRTNDGTDRLGRRDGRLRGLRADDDAGGRQHARRQGARAAPRADTEGVRGRVGLLSLLGLVGGRPRRAGARRGAVDTRRPLGAAGGGAPVRRLPGHARDRRAEPRRAE